MQVWSARSKEELRHVVEFAQRVYRDDPYWVPPNEEERVGLLNGEAPNGAHTRTRTFWAGDRPEDIRAAVTAAVDDAFNRHWNELIGHLFFFEAMPDSDLAVKALLDEACIWLRGQGCAFARLSFHYGWQLPLTIDAYDAVPTVLHTHNPPYYHRLIKNAGFATERGFAEYEVPFAPEPAEDYKRMVAQAAESGIGLRNWNAGDLRQEAARFHDIYLDTYARHWGTPRFTLPEVEALVTELKDLSVSDFSQFATLDGQIVGAVLAFSEVNQALHAMRGKDLGANLEEFQYHVKGIDRGILLSVSVKEAARGRGVALAMAARAFLAMMERGYRRASYTIVLDDNWASRRTAERLGGTVARNYTTYGRELV